MISSSSSSFKAASASSSSKSRSSNKCINCSVDLSSRENSSQSQSGFHSLTCTSRVRSPLSPATVELIPVHHALSTVFTVRKSGKRLESDLDPENDSDNDNGSSVARRTTRARARAREEEADDNDFDDNDDCKNIPQANPFSDLTLTSQPICFTCYLVLSDLYRTYTEFSQLRRNNSYIADKLRELEKSSSFSTITSTSTTRTRIKSLSSCENQNQNINPIVSVSLPRRSDRSRTKIVEAETETRSEILSRNCDQNDNDDENFELHQHQKHPHRQRQLHRHRSLHRNSDHSKNEVEPEPKPESGQNVTKVTSAMSSASSLSSHSSSSQPQPPQLPPSLESSTAAIPIPNILKLEVDEEAFEEFQDDENHEDEDNDESLDLDMNLVNTDTFSVDEHQGDFKYSYSMESMEDDQNFSEYSSDYVDRDPLASTNQHQHHQLLEDNAGIGIETGSERQVSFSFPADHSSRAVVVSNRLKNSGHLLRKGPGVLPPQLVQLHQHAQQNQNQEAESMWVMSREDGRLGEERRGPGRPRGSVTGSGSKKKRNGPSDEPRIFCQAGCGKDFSTRKGMLRHMKEQHSGVKPFSCQLCHKRFARRDHLNAHLCGKYIPLPTVTTL